MSIFDEIREAKKWRDQYGWPEEDEPSWEDLAEIALAAKELAKASERCASKFGRDWTENTDVLDALAAFRKAVGEDK